VRAVVSSRLPAVFAALLILFGAPLWRAGAARADALPTIALGEPTVIDVADPNAPTQVTFFTTASAGRLTVLIDEMTVPYGVDVTLSHSVRGGGSTRATGPAYMESTIYAAGTWTLGFKPVKLYSGHVPGTGKVRVTVDAVQDVSGEIAVGEPFTQDFPKPGVNADLTFIAEAGRDYAFDVRQSSTDGGQYAADGITATLVGPPGTDDVHLLTTQNESAWWHIWPLPVGGRWTLHLDPQHAATGSITAALLAPPEIDGGQLKENVQQTVDIAEPGSTVSFTLKGQAGRHPVLDFDTSQLSWRTGRPHEPVTAQLQRTDGTNLSSFTADAVWGEAPAFAEDGTYRLILDPALEATGSFTVTYRQVKDVVGTLPLGRSGTVAATVPAQNALLTFAGSEGKMLRLDVSSQSWSTRDGGPDQGWVYLRYLRPDGSEAAQGTLYAPDDQHGTVVVDGPVMDSSGTWTLVVDPAEDSLGSVTGRASLETPSPAME
jgi:hypothetical protein